MHYLKLILTIAFVTLLSACGNKKENTQKANNIEETTEVETPIFKNKGHELVYKMSQKTGSYKDLLQLKDVSYHYTYRTPDQKEDVSIESYVFNGELSHGKYIKHERTLPKLKGEIEQGYNGKDFWIKLNGKDLTDQKAIESVTFTRKTNFYWFAMMQKLLDPGINYEYLGQENVLDVTYDVVKVTFQSETASDTYQLYINPKTNLVDQFLFTVVSKGVNDPILMRVTYSEIDGVLLPTYRKYTKSDWNATVIKDVWVEELSKDIKFNQNLDNALFNN